MPLDLDDVLNDARWVDVETDGGLLRIAYRPSATSWRKQAEITRKAREVSANKDADELDGLREAAKIFCEVVSAWDLTRGGKPLTVNVEVVLDLPESMREAIMDAIREDRQGRQNEKKVSSASLGVTLPRGDRQASVRNGIPSSEEQNTWA